MSKLKTRVRELAEAGKRADGTRRCYESCWRSFASWCASVARDALPASEETVCLYIAGRCDGLKVGTLHVHLAAIRERHEAAGHGHPVGPEVHRVMAGLSRKRGLQPEPKAAVTPAQLRAMLATIDRSDFRGSRNAAVLLLGFSSGLRRSDLVALDLADLKFVQQGMVVRVGWQQREKNDQAGEGRRLAIFPGSRPETCPISAVRSWLVHRGRSAGPVFTRSDPAAGSALDRLRPQMVWAIVRKAAAAAGLDAGDFGAHSLRAGMATAMAADGAADTAIMQRTGHKSVAMVGRYVRHAELFARNPLAKAL